MIGERKLGEDGGTESGPRKIGGETTPRKLDLISYAELRALLRGREKTDFSYLKVVSKGTGKPNMTRVHFKGNFEGTDMSYMDARRATFGAARIPGADFSYADLRGAGGLDMAEGLKLAHFYHTVVEKEQKWKLEAATREEGVTPDLQRFKARNFEEPELWIKRV
jgi:hypothetical protein